jgi:preprotein translocase subunit SecE
MSEKIGIMERTRTFFGEVRTELSKVVWPTREQVKNWTIVVLVASAVVAALMGAWDWVLSLVVERLFHLG